MRIAYSGGVFSAPGPSASGYHGVGYDANKNATGVPVVRQPGGGQGCCSRSPLLEAPILLRSSKQRIQRRALLIRRHREVVVNVVSPTAVGRARTLATKRCSLH